MQQIKQISAHQLKNMLDISENAPILLDVREPAEHQICKIEGSLLIPMQLIPDYIDQLDPDQETVVICHHGMRSLQVAEYLQNHGFSRLVNLNGGIEQWRLNIDPSMRAY